MKSEFLEHIKRELIYTHNIPSILFDYLEDRIAQIVDDKLSQAVADMEERIREDLQK